MSYLEIPIKLVGAENHDIHEHPVEVGIPFPRSLMDNTGKLSLLSGSQKRTPFDITPTLLWPDGSIRWALLRFLASDSLYRLCLAPDASDARQASLQISESDDEITIDTGSTVFAISRRFFSLSSHPAVFSTDREMLSDCQGRQYRFKINSVDFEHRGMAAVTILLTGQFVNNRKRAICSGQCRLSFWAGTSLLRAEFTIWNPKAAKHPSGIWDLGDPGSVFFRSLHICFRFPNPGPRSLSLSALVGGDLSQSTGLPLSIHQSSSGGPNWRSVAHIDKNNQITPKFHGYRLLNGKETSQGLRANPAALYRDAVVSAGFALENFWESFPNRLEINEGSVSVEPFPSADGQDYELQGGEKATFRMWADFNCRGETTALLPARLKIAPGLPPEWYRDSECFPGFPTSFQNMDSWLAQLIQSGIEGQDSFFERRELFDEYGWRHFGETAADHEKLHYKAAGEFVSHYNNQYDLVLGFLSCFAATGDRRWFELGCDLARHVLDHDLYHTSRDKSAYNGGYFWHTSHYMHAGAATHRAYSRLANGGAPLPPGFGGGPSNEHNYTTGLALYFLMTGDRRGRESVEQLAAWVRDMQDVWLTPLRYLSRNPTGRATCTRDLHYQGPGRGGAYSINASLDAYLLTGNRFWLNQAESFLRTCIHPADNPGAMNLLNREDRWSYTVFLQIIGRYLKIKEEHGEFDRENSYARTALMGYASWMLESEYPYLDRPEELEYPTSTWAAQEFRKSCVFLLAAKYADSLENERLREKARFFVETSRAHLSRFKDANCTRCMALILSNYLSYLQLSSENRDGRISKLPAVEAKDFGPKTTFVPQKIDALQKLRHIIKTAGIAGFVELFRYLSDARRKTK